MSNIYNQLCTAIKNGYLIEIEKITEGIISRNDPSEIKLIYDNYSSDKTKFRMLFERETLLLCNNDLKESDILEIQSMLNRFIASILVIQNDLSETEQRLKRKNDEPHPDEPQSKRAKINQDQELPATSVVEINYHQILSDLNFLPNEIHIIIKNSKNLAGDAEYIMTLAEVYKMSHSFIYKQFIEHGGLSRLHDVVAKLSELRLSTENPTGFTIEHILNMVKNNKAYANSLFLVGNWHDIKTSYFTLDEIEKIVTRYDRSMIDDIFFYLGELRSRKCPHPFVTHISMKTKKNVLTLLYKNFEKFAEYGWFRVEEFGMKELSFLLKQINTMQEMMDYLSKNPVGDSDLLTPKTNLVAALPLTQTNTVSINKEKQRPVHDAVNHYPQQERLATNIPDFQQSQQFAPAFIQEEYAYNPSFPYNRYTNTTTYYPSSNPYANSSNFISPTVYPVIPHQSNYASSTYNFSNYPTPPFYQVVQPQVPNIITQVHFNTINYYPLTMNPMNTNLQTYEAHQTMMNHSNQKPLSQPDTHGFTEAPPQGTHASALQNWGIFNPSGVNFAGPLDLVNDLSQYP